MRITTKSMTAVFMPFALSACATVIRGPNVDFHVITEPPGATVTTTLEDKAALRRWKKENGIVVESETLDQSSGLRFFEMQEEARASVDGENATDAEDAFPKFYKGCTPTPCKFEVSRRAEFTTTVTLDGYHPANVEITSGLGRGGGTATGVGTAAATTGAYVLTYSLIETMYFIGTFGLGSSSAAASAATSSANSAALGIGAIMIGVDVASGAMLDVRPNPLGLVLIPDDQPLPDQADILIDTEEKLDAVRAEQKKTSDDNQPES